MVIFRGARRNQSDLIFYRMIKRFPFFVVFTVLTKTQSIMKRKAFSFRPILIAVFSGALFLLMPAVSQAQVADKVEDAVDRAENKRDRKENKRDRKENKRDRKEDRHDAREDVRDAKEDVRDRKENKRDRKENKRDRKENKRDRKN